MSKLDFLRANAENTTAAIILDLAYSRPFELT